MGQTAEELRDQLEQQRGDISRDLVAIGDRVSPGRMVERRKAAVRQTFGRMRESVMGAADATTSSMGSTASSAGSTVGDAASAVTGTASAIAGTVAGAPRAAAHQAQGNPLAAGLVAFGAGLLAASLLPSTRREEQLVADHVQPMLETAAEGLSAPVGAMVEDLTDEAKEAAEDLKGSVQQSAETVKTEATTAATDTAAQAKEAAASIADKAT